MACQIDHGWSLHAFPRLLVLSELCKVNSSQWLQTFSECYHFRLCHTATGALYASAHYKWIVHSFSRSSYSCLCRFTPAVEHGSNALRCTKGFQNFRQEGKIHLLWSETMVFLGHFVLFGDDLHNGACIPVAHTGILQKVVPQCTSGRQSYAI